MFPRLSRGMVLAAGLAGLGCGVALGWTGYPPLEVLSPSNLSVERLYTLTRYNRHKSSNAPIPSCKQHAQI